MILEDKPSAFRRLLFCSLLEVEGYCSKTKDSHCHCANKQKQCVFFVLSFCWVKIDAEKITTGYLPVHLSHNRLSLTVCTSGQLKQL